MLGDAILTAGAHAWRWQRQAAAPIFGYETRTFVPAMIAAAERRRERWLSRVGEEVNVAQEMLHTTFDIIAETMLSGRGGIDVDKLKGATDYSNSITWVIATFLTLLRAPLWMPYPGRSRVERARDYLREEVARIVAERRRSDQERNDLVVPDPLQGPELGRSAARCKEASSTHLSTGSWQSWRTVHLGVRVTRLRRPAMGQTACGMPFPPPPGARDPH